MAKEDSDTKKRPVSIPADLTLEKMLAHCDVSHGKIPEVPPHIKGKRAAKKFMQEWFDEFNRDIDRAARRRRLKIVPLIKHTAYRESVIGWFDQVPSDAMKCGTA